MKKSLKVVKISPKKVLHINSLYDALKMRIDDHIEFSKMPVTVAEIVGTLDILKDAYK